MFQQYTHTNTHPVFHELYDDMERKEGIGSWLMHADKGIFSLSPNLCRMAGISNAGHLADIYKVVHPDDRASFLAMIQALQSSGELPENVFRIMKDKKTWVIHQLVRRYTDTDGERYLYGCWKTVPEDRRTGINSVHSSALANRDLKRRNAELHTFSYITSNDLKETLRRIYTSIELLVTQEMPGFTEKGRIHFRQIQGAVQKIALLADDFVYFSRLDAEKADLGDVDLNQVFSMALKKQEEQLVASRTSIRADSLPAYHGHRTTLVLLFQHMVSNAVKFREPGTVPEIIISAETQPGSSVTHPDADPAAVYLVIHFRDNGIGFDPKYAERIFDASMRINRGKYPGVGRGLTLCKKIAELHGGFIIAESKPGAGSTFHCYLQKGL